MDVAASVEALGQKLGFSQENGKYFSVSLGQGQVSEGRSVRCCHLVKHARSLLAPVLNALLAGELQCAYN